MAAICSDLILSLAEPTAHLRRVLLQSGAHWLLAEHVL